MLLIDSGGQYTAGTTDITRVVPVGEPTAEQRRDYTLVLKGMINLSRTRFPRGTRSPALDALARAPLWAAGLDFGHGTGHGVGYFLNVHEGPHGITPLLPNEPQTAMEPGMVTSNEPGVYRPGRWGVRIENLILNVPDETTEFAEFLRFEALTLCPIDTRPVERALLTAEEIAWLNDYHATVRRGSPRTSAARRASGSSGARNRCDALTAALTAVTSARRLRPLLQAAGSTALVALLAACGSGGGGAAPTPSPPTSPPPPPPGPPPLVVVAPESQFRVSPASPFAANCEAPTAGTAYVNSEVEPHVAVNPANPSNWIAVWQQDRWSNGSARGTRSAVTFNGGGTWASNGGTFSVCGGGTAGNSGNYQRSTDPWVAFAPNGTAFQMALSTSGTSLTAGSSNAMLVARSTDGGLTWGAPTTLILDGGSFFNDKNTITADPTDARFVYAAWDRLAPAAADPRSSRARPTTASPGKRRARSTTPASMPRRSATSSWCCRAACCCTSSPRSTSAATPPRARCSACCARSTRVRPGRRRP